ncbi:hypothetical protein NGM37_53220, partial [Streptomyces sp. TRM76130]|nr:hypothetical protein [Streptomyces sp. TRM76130]
ASVQTPGDGYCLLYAVIGSAPQVVGNRLTRAGGPALDPGTAAWLARPDQVRRTLTALAVNPAATGQGTGHLRATRRRLQDLVLARLAAARGGGSPLSPQVLGQLRGVLVGSFAAQAWTAPAGWVDARLAQFGIQGVTRAEDMDPDDLQSRYRAAVSAPGAPQAPPGAPPSNRQMYGYLRSLDALPTLATMSPDERRHLLVARYHGSTAPLAAAEADVLERAVRDWSDEWDNPVGDAFLPLLADTLGVPIHVFQPAPSATAQAGGARGIVLPYGRTDTTVPAMELYYTGRNHYSASDAGPLATPATTTTTTSPTTGTGTNTASTEEAEETEDSASEDERATDARVDGDGSDDNGDNGDGDDDDDGLDDRPPPPVPRGERPDSFVRSLSRLLTGSGAAPAWTRSRDPHGALLAWARQDVASRGAPDDAPLPAGDTPVSIDDLARVGSLTESLRAQSILQNGGLTVADAALTDSARLELLLAAPDTPGYVAALAALVARRIGRPVRVLGPGGTTRAFGPPDGTALTLYFDGDRFSSVPPAADDD